MEIQHAKHVRIICDLNVGDKVRTGNWGYKLDGKEWIVEEIMRHENCESGFMVKINGYESFIDSNWLNRA